MNEQDSETIQMYKELAPKYDSVMKGNNYVANDILFGLMYEFIKPNETLLDVCIGTGLSSVLFHKADLKIYGLDASSEMLEVCESKGFVSELKCYMIERNSAFPYHNLSFDHIILLTALLKFRSLDFIFEEIARIIKKGGVFGFDVLDLKENEEKEFTYTSRSTQKLVRLHRHSSTYIDKLLHDNGFVCLKNSVCEIYKGFPLAKVYVVRKE